MSVSASGPVPSSPAAPAGLSGGGGGTGTPVNGGGGTGTPGEGGNWLQRFVREWVAPSALAAIVLAIFGWLLTDKFSTLNDQIKDIKSVTDRLDARLTSADTANRAVNDLLNSKSLDLVDRIAATSQTVTAISGDMKILNQKIDGLSDDMKSVKSGVTALEPIPELMRSLDSRTTRIEGVIIQAPWVKK